jgi:PAS domain S-box-containing protein
MRTVLVVSGDQGLHGRLHAGLGGRSVFAVTSDEEGLRTLRMTAVDLIVKEVAPPAQAAGEFLARARALSPGAVVLCVVPPAGVPVQDEEYLEAADFVLLQPFTPSQLQALLRQAEEKLRLLQEVSALRTERRPGVWAAEPVEPGLAGGSDAPALPLAPVVKEFAKALSAGFDLPRLLELFLDAIGEMAQPSRSALLLPEAGTGAFRVEASRGLAPHVARAARLAPDGGLPRWLMTHGRILAVEEAQGRSGDAAVWAATRDLALLQAVIAVPLVSHGELVAILTLGQRVTGGPYGRQEAEGLFGLAAHMATAILDAQVHHELRYQKQFNERILSHMSSGVVTISPEQRVIIFNRRAEEILGLAARDVLGQDLRVLPSPLGDLLYETLTRGRTLHRDEIQIALRQLPLEVSAYAVHGDGGGALGAVLVFEDLTTQRQLAQQRRHAEQRELLTRVVARVADEIKNPLVSIRTFMELLEERYDDASFRHHFSAVVGRDVRRLVQLFEKLSALVDEGDYKAEPVDIQTVAEECLAELGAQVPADGVTESRLFTFFDESTQKQVAATLSREGQSFMVRGDRGTLRRALAYLVWYLLRRSPGQEAKLSIAISQVDRDERVRVTIASRTAEVRGDELHRLFDPVLVVQENLIDVGPCVSQRIIEAQGGRLEARHGRSEVSFTAALPRAGA